MVTKLNFMFLYVQVAFKSFHQYYYLISPSVSKYLEKLLTGITEQEWSLHSSLARLHIMVYTVYSSIWFKSDPRFETLQAMHIQWINEQKIMKPHNWKLRMNTALSNTLILPGRVPIFPFSAASIKNNDNIVCEYKYLGKSYDESEC